jgi:hypothetical protein
MDEAHTHLHPTHVLPNVRPDDGPSLRVRRNVRLRDADRKLPKHATKKFKIRELHRIDADVLAQLDDDEPRPRATRRKHVPVPLRGQNVRRRLGGRRGLRGVNPRGAVHRRVVEPVRQWHAEVRRGRRRRLRRLRWWHRRRGPCAALCRRRRCVRQFRSVDNVDCVIGSNPGGG